LTLTSSLSTPSSSASSPLVSSYRVASRTGLARASVMEPARSRSLMSRRSPNRDSRRRPTCLAALRTPAELDLPEPNEKFADRTVQGSGERNDFGDRRIPLSAFDPADVIAMTARTGGKGLLGEASSEPAAAHICAELSEQPIAHAL